MAKKKWVKDQSEENESVPLPKEDSRLFDDEGNEVSAKNDNWRSMSSKGAFQEKQREKSRKEEDKKLEGKEGRSVGEHILAGARAVFEGTKFRENQASGRDPKYPLYDRRYSKKD